MQNITSLIQKNDTIVVYAGQENPEDSFPAALALCDVIRERNKPSFLFSCVPIPHRLNFLPFSSIVSSNDPFAQRASLCVETQHDVSSIHYTQHRNRFYITLSHNNATVPFHNITTQPPPIQNECVIALGCNKQEIRRICDSYSIHPDNVVSVNAQDLREHNAQSYCEVLVQALKMDPQTTVTQRIATILLTGIILSTDNFQQKGIESQTFFNAAYLVAQKADKDLIIQNLYKKKKCSVYATMGSYF